MNKFRPETREGLQIYSHTERCNYPGTKHTHTYTHQYPGKHSHKHTHTYECMRKLAAQKVHLKFSRLSKSWANAEGVEG